MILRDPIGVHGKLCSAKPVGSLMLDGMPCSRGRQTRPPSPFSAGEHRLCQQPRRPSFARLSEPLYDNSSGPTARLGRVAEPCGEQSAISVAFRPDSDPNP